MTNSFFGGHNKLKVLASPLLCIECLGKIKKNNSVALVVLIDSNVSFLGAFCPLYSVYI